MFSRTSRLNQKPVVLRIFRVLHTVQFSRFVVVCSQQQLVYLITTRCVCQQLFYFLFGSLPKPFQISLKLPCRSQRRVISYHNFTSVSSTFLKFFKICFSSVFWMKRRKRDLNPRAGFPTYTLSRGASSASWVFLRIDIFHMIASFDMLVLRRIDHYTK